MPKNYYQEEISDKSVKNYYAEEISGVDVDKQKNLPNTILSHLANVASRYFPIPKEGNLLAKAWAVTTDNDVMRGLQRGLVQAIPIIKGSPLSDINALASRLEAEKASQPYTPLTGAQIRERALADIPEPQTMLGRIAEPAAAIAGTLPLMRGLSAGLQLLGRGAANVPLLAKAGQAIAKTPVLRAAPKLAATTGARVAGYMGAKDVAEGNQIDPVRLAQIGTIAQLGVVGGRAGATIFAPIGRLLGRGLESAGRTGARAGAITGAALTDYGIARGFGGSHNKAIEQAALGGAMEGIMPSRPYSLKGIGQNLAQQATNIYRDVLRPTQGEVKNIEIRKGKNIDDYYRLAAQEKLPLGETPDKKIDTSLARAKIQEKATQSHAELSTILRKDKTRKFSLEWLRNQAKKESRATVKNATELKTVNNDIDEYINDEINLYSSDMVNAEQLNNVKQGMWKVGYNQSRPTAKKTARRIGFITENMIEKAYPDQNIKALNRKTGDYLELLDLLENAQGRVIKGGRLGGYAARIGGAIVGGMAGQAIPVPGAGAALGAMGGMALGQKAADYIYSPARRANLAARKMTKAENIPTKEQFLKELETRLGRKIYGETYGQTPIPLGGPQRGLMPYRQQQVLKPEYIGQASQMPMLRRGQIPQTNPMIALPAKPSQIFPILGKGFMARKPLPEDYFLGKGEKLPRAQEKINEIKTQLLSKIKIDENVEKYFSTKTGADFLNNLSRRVQHGLTVKQAVIQLDRYAKKMSNLLSIKNVNKSKEVSL